jgi:hypothetical protein
MEPLEGTCGPEKTGQSTVPFLDTPLPTGQTVRIGGHCRGSLREAGAQDRQEQDEENQDGRHIHPGKKTEHSAQGQCSRKSLSRITFAHNHLKAGLIVPCSVPAPGHVTRLAGTLQA